MAGEEGTTTDGVAGNLERDQNLAQRVAAVVDRHGKRMAGLAVGVGRGDETTIVGRGQIGDMVPDPPKPDTIFEIGSITKVFTATLLTQLAGEGLVELNQPVNELLPVQAQLPVRERPITLSDLATHSSGLPRLPRGWFRKSMLHHRANPYAPFTVDDLHRAIVETKLRRPPGRAVRYSNFGAGLLGHVLALRLDTTYEELVRERICVPLGLPNTSITVTASREQFADGHNRAGRPVLHWDLPTLAGAGALRSTVTDMLRFLEAQYARDDTPLHRAIRRTHHPHFHRGALDQCLGWVSLSTGPGSDTRVLWHNGGTGGFRSFCAVVPERRTRVVVLVNCPRSADRIGQELLRAIA
jgi:CubicO group peptidase (beta-lactamase class C family)